MVNRRPAESYVRPREAEAESTPQTLLSDNPERLAIVIHLLARCAGEWCAFSAALNHHIMI
jgi:hypothetical protein